jgi:hypothetical protein
MPAYEPMTLGKTRAHGMTQLDVSCHWGGLLATAPWSMCRTLPTT